jgi:hypothetical protein
MNLTREQVRDQIRNTIFSEVKNRIIKNQPQVMANLSWCKEPTDVGIITAAHKVYFGVFSQVVMQVKRAVEVQIKTKENKETNL